MPRTHSNDYHCLCLVWFFVQFLSGSILVNSQFSGGWEREQDDHRVSYEIRSICRETAHQTQIQSNQPDNSTPQKKCYKSHE